MMWMRFSAHDRAAHSARWSRGYDGLEYGAQAFLVRDYLD